MILSSAVAHNICIVDIENSVPAKISKSESLIVIDKDLCEIVDKN